MLSVDACTGMKTARDAQAWPLRSICARTAKRRNPSAKLVAAAKWCFIAAGAARCSTGQHTRRCARCTGTHHSDGQVPGRSGARTHAPDTHAEGSASFRATRPGSSRTSRSASCRESPFAHEIEPSPEEAKPCLRTLTLGPVRHSWDGYWAVKPKKIILGDWDGYFK